jgi:magnesium-dependent phosphatase 1
MSDVKVPTAYGQILIKKETITPYKKECSVRKICKKLIMSEDDCRHLPTMIVFDLDDCLWTPEMHELYDMPSIPVHGDIDPSVADRTSKGTFRNSKSLPRTVKAKHSRSSDGSDIGVVGMKVPGTSQTVYLYDGARLALREIALDPKFRNVIIAVASTSLEPSYSHQCLNNIEILPGLTMRDMISYDEIGRTGHLTSRKTTHFTALHNESQVPYHEMLFFDDCNWGDHCGDISDTFGVVSQRTPNGLQLSEFHDGLQKYRTHTQKFADK